MPRLRPMSGLTLIELLVGIALLAVVLALAAPGSPAQLPTGQLSSPTQPL